MITVFATYRNEDMTGGRGPMVLDKVFMVERDAQTYINQQDGVMGRRPEDFGKPGWQNSDMNDWEVKQLHILECLEDGEAYVRAQNLERAYAKLTQAEKEAVEFHVRNALT